MPNIFGPLLTWGHVKWMVFGIKEMNFSLSISFSFQGSLVIKSSHGIRANTSRSVPSRFEESDIKKIEFSISINSLLKYNDYQNFTITYESLNGGEMGAA